MRKDLILITFVLSLFLLTSVSADLGFYKQGENISVKGNLDATSVYTSIYYPNSSVIIDNQLMTSLYGNIWEYQLNGSDAVTLGKYIYDYCDQDGDNCQENFFTVTNSGLEFPKGSQTFLVIAIIFLFIIGGLFFVGFVKEDRMQVKWSLFIVGFMFVLASLNIISVTIYDNITSQALISFFDSLTGIMFIVFWIGFALLAVMWFLTLLRAILFKKSMKQAAKFGGMME